MSSSRARRLSPPATEATRPRQPPAQEYTVQAGDSLESIAQAYMAKNTYGPRELKEFKSGIVQLNDWLLTRDLQAGDKVKVNYWVSQAE